MKQTKQESVAKGTWRHVLSDTFRHRSPCSRQQDSVVRCRGRVREDCCLGTQTSTMTACSLFLNLIARNRRKADETLKNDKHNTKNKNAVFVILSFQVWF